MSRKFSFTLKTNLQFSVYADSVEDAKAKALAALRETFELELQVINVKPIDMTGGASEGNLYFNEGVEPERIGMSKELPETPGF